MRTPRRRRSASTAGLRGEAEVSRQGRSDGYPRLFAHANHSHPTTITGSTASTAVMCTSMSCHRAGSALTIADLTLRSVTTVLIQATASDTAALLLYISRLCGTSCLLLLPGRGAALSARPHRQTGRVRQPDPPRAIAGVVQQYAEHLRHVIVPERRGIPGDSLLYLRSRSAESVMSSSLPGQPSATAAMALACSPPPRRPVACASGRQFVVPAQPAVHDLFCGRRRPGPSWLSRSRAAYNVPRACALCHVRSHVRRS